MRAGLKAYLKCRQAGHGLEALQRIYFGEAPLPELLEDELPDTILAAKREEVAAALFRFLGSPGVRP